MSRIDTATAGTTASTDLSAASDAVQPAADSAELSRLRARATEAAVKFEAFFIKQMMKQMRASTAVLADEDSPLKKRVNEDMLELADGVVADAMAGQRAFGIADLMLKQVLPTLNAGSTDLSSGATGSPLKAKEARSSGTSS